MKWIAIRNNSPGKSEKNNIQLESGQKKYTLRVSDKKSPQNVETTRYPIQTTNLSNKFLEVVQSPEKSTSNVRSPIRYESFNKNYESNKSSNRKTTSPDGLNYFNHEVSIKNEFYQKIEGSPYFHNPSYKLSTEQNSDKKTNFNPSDFKRELRKNDELIHMKEGSLNSGGSSHLSPRSKIKKLVCQTVKDVKIPFPGGNKENSTNLCNTNINNNSEKTSQLKSLSRYDPYNLINSISKKHRKSDYDISKLSNYHNVVSLKSPSSPIPAQKIIPNIDNFKKYSQMTKNNFYSDLRHASHENTQSDIDLEQDFAEVKTREIDDYQPKIVIETSYHGDSKPDNVIKMTDYKNDPQTQFFLKNIR